MVSKGLKVGDTFTDGNFTYKVNKVDELGNYVSSLVDTTGEGVKPSKTVKVEDAPKKRKGVIASKEIEL